MDIKMLNMVLKYGFYVDAIRILQFFIYFYVCF